MLESIEGKRGLPRHKPPFPSQVGLFGRPTLINNVETVFWVRDIVEKGPESFASHGRNGRKGLRTFSVSGRVRNPGVKLAPAGITARELIDEFCGGMAEGHSFKGYLPGGASGGILPASMADIPLDFGTLEPHGCFIGSAAVVVLSDKDNMRDVALNLLKFFEDESCGQCTPCRIGTEKAVHLMERPRWDEPLLERVDPSDDRCLDLRPRPGGDEPGEAGAEAFSRRPDDEGLRLAPMTDGLPIFDGVKFFLDGREVEARPGETIWQVASRHGTDIPHLCHSPAPGYRPDGNCRACMVEIEGERVLAASCVRKPAHGMKVSTATERAESSRKLVFELLVADQPDRAVAHDPNSRFWNWADRIDVTTSRFPAIERPNKADDFSHPAMAVQLDACIHCNLCVRACREVQVNDVIGMAARGHLEKIVFDFDDPMGTSTCVACGECVQACPTGALMEKTPRRRGGRVHQRARSRGP